MVCRLKWAVVPALLLAVPAVAAPVADPATAQASLESRLTRVERVLESRALLDMRATMEQLQREVQELRGLVEQQSHDLGKLKQQQRDLYLDIDRRLQQSSSRSSTVPQLSTPPHPTTFRPVTPAATPSTTQAPAAQPALPPATRPMVSLPSRTPQAVVPSQGEQMAYQHAFSLLKEGNYRQSISAFSSQLQQFPRGNYADNARYWLGESHYVMRDFAPALVEFERVLEEFPSSSKVPDAMLKIGYIRYELKEYAEAQRLFETIKARYSGTRSARLADKRLQQMRQEGR